MKKSAILLIAILLVFSLTACDDNGKENTDTQPSAETESNAGPDSKGSSEIPSDIDSVPDSTEEEAVDATEIEVVENTMTEEEATEAYKTMVGRFEMESPVDVYDDVTALLPKLPDHISSILFAKFDRYMENWSMSYSDQMYFEDGPMSRMDVALGQSYDYETNSYDLEKISNETHKAIIESLLNSGFKFIWLEGSPYPFIDYSQFKSLGEKTPEEVMAFILVMSKETDSITAADAGIIISWNELASRAVNTENAMKIIQNEDLYAKTESLYRFYTSSYLLGMNNTPVVGWEDDKMLQEVLDSYNKTISSHPDSELAKIVESYLSALNTLDYTLPYSDQEKFQSIVKMQSDWIDKAIEALHSHHGH